jgi:hypothetical protein
MLACRIKIAMRIIAAILSVLIISCNNKAQPDLPNCNEIKFNESLSYENMLDGIDAKLLLQTVEQPDINGALSRNKNGYFSVRFQMNMTKLSDLSIKANRIDALKEYLKTLEYSFSHQYSNGSYQLTIPEDLMNDLSINLPNKGDSVSAVAFFNYALAISLNSLHESKWYNYDNEAVEIKNKIEAFLPNIQKTLNYLINNQSVLRQIDGQAPNRLFFDALAFYGLGKVVKNNKALTLATEFINLELNLVNKEQGFFIEGGGWDSSYNGVAIKLGLELYSMLPNSHPDKTKLEKALVCATLWQQSRILESGEISAEGNTRVYPGGESFLGNEKEVDVEKTIRAFYYFAELTNNDEYWKLANKIYNYYK